jgi:hypothetical protein
VGLASPALHMQREGTLVRKHLLRAALGLTTAALVGGTLAAPAQAATGRATSAGDWLESQLTDGIVHNDQFDFDDIGLTLDFFLALRKLGVHPEARDAILTAVEPQVGGYVGTGGEAYAAQYGKLLTAVQMGGLAPGDYAGGSLATELRSLVRTEGRRTGQAVDRSDFGNFTETIGQSFVVRAFGLEGRMRMARLTTAHLLRQQCKGGFFRESMKTTVTCQAGRAKGVSAPSVDATAFGVEALRTARRAGVKGLGDDIDDALRWLRKVQNRNGSFTGNGVPNSNSTGLAASVLAGRFDAAAKRAATWLSRRQVTARNSAGTPLAGEVGAVAYDVAGFRTGKADGITVSSRDQWRRATAQASVGLDAL